MGTSRGIDSCMFLLRMNSSSILLSLEMLAKCLPNSFAIKLSSLKILLSISILNVLEYFFFLFSFLISSQNILLLGLVFDAFILSIKSTHDLCLASFIIYLA
uniref:Uncharacterized protein n=1 Tax=Cacopsylla melanoneura TaxID=428564 RepID=A0A8D8X6T7_9HEMI